MSPVSYYALSVGNWDALILYGSLPWALIMIGRAGESSLLGNLAGKSVPTLSVRTFLRGPNLISVGVIVSLSPVSVCGLLLSRF